MTVTNWTPRLVEAFLVAAAEVHRRLPPVNVPGHFNTWPSSARETRTVVLDDCAPLPAVPAPQEITAMESTMLWLRWLDRDAQQIVWDRANGRPWKAIANDLGVVRNTAFNRWKVAVAMITARLNAESETMSRHRETRHYQTNRA